MAKSNTLQAYFKVIGLKPKKIVFVDEDINLVKQMARYCEMEKITFVGFEYTAVKSNQKILDSIPKWQKFNLKL